MTNNCFAIYRKSSLLLLLITIIAIYLLVICSAEYTTASSETGGKRELEILKSIPFENTTLTSIAVDPIRNLVFVSANPKYPYDDKISQCREENDTSANSIPNYVAAYPAMYVIDGNTGDIMDIVRLRQGEIIHDMYMDINPYSKIYAVGFQVAFI